MPSKKLHIQTETDCYLIAISCHQQSYKLAWELNGALDIDLELSTTYDESIPFVHLLPGHEYYIWTHESERFSVHLVSNKSTEGFIYPKLPQIDFILAVTGFYEELDMTKGIAQIKSIKSVLTAFELTPNM